MKFGDVIQTIGAALDDLQVMLNNEFFGEVIHDKTLEKMGVRTIAFFKSRGIHVTAKVSSPPNLMDKGFIKIDCGMAGYTFTIMYGPSTLQFHCPSVEAG